MIAIPATDVSIEFANEPGPLSDHALEILAELLVARAVRYGTDDDAVEDE